MVSAGATWELYKIFTPGPHSQRSGQPGRVRPLQSSQVAVQPGQQHCLRGTWRRWGGAQTVHTRAHYKVGFSAPNLNAVFYVDAHVSGQNIQSFLSDSQWVPCPLTDELSPVHFKRVPLEVPDRSRAQPGRWVGSGLTDLMDNDDGHAPLKRLHS